MEPQWNPTVEEQALARVHRMGQTKAGTTIRFVMEGTFEEVCYLQRFGLVRTHTDILQRVVETQERKRELAELLLSPEQHGEAEHGIDRLKVSWLTCPSAFVRRY
jgi:SWI/SNF-related matrix-associated actin-dependent regulator of chromatin subfamily A3